MALADGTALYRVRGAEGLLIYIGISDNFGRRWREHARKQPWWAEMRSLSVDEWFGSRADAKVAEEAAIKAERPKHNKAHNTPGPTLVRQELSLVLSDRRALMSEDWPPRNCRLTPEQKRHATPADYEVA